MSETNMTVKLLGHTQLSEEFLDKVVLPDDYEAGLWEYDYTDGQVVALSAIRTCYSANKPSEVVAKEGPKYFGEKATDGEGGTDADRLCRHIVRSGHTSTLEHLSYTFAIEGVSRALLAQLTRHRVGFSYSVQSQRYVRFGSGDRSGGFDYVTPDTIFSSTKKVEFYDHGEHEYRDGYATEVFEDVMEHIQMAYDALRKAGVPAEDARSVLPQAATTNLVMTANLRALLDFCKKRRDKGGAQAEIVALAEELKAKVIEVEPWTKQFFDENK